MNLQKRNEEDSIIYGGGDCSEILSRQRYSMNGADLLHNASVACTMLKGQNGARKRTLYQDIYRSTIHHDDITPLSVT